MQPEKFTDYIPGVNFINILFEAFTRADLKSSRKTDDLTVFFVLLGSAHVNVLHKMLVKLSTGVNETRKILTMKGQEKSKFAI
jgi:hypothetical protein